MNVNSFQIPDTYVEYLVEFSTSLQVFGPHSNSITFVGFVIKLNIYQVIIFARGISCSEAVRFVGRSPGCINFATLIRWFMAAIFTFVFGVWVESTRNLKY